MTEERKDVIGARTATNLTGTVTWSKEALEPKSKARARARAKRDIAMIAESKGLSGPTAQTKQRTKVRRRKVSLKEKRHINSRSRRLLTTREIGAGQKGTVLFIGVRVGARVWMSRMFCP